MYERDTIVAIATAAGSAGVGIVRISGEDALAIGRRVFPCLPRSPRSHHLYFGDVVARGGLVLDQGLAVWMRSPSSFTGEHVVEIHCHGGTLLVRRVLEAVLMGGARAAEAGEFSRRAFVNGRIDLAQAESVADLIAARSPAALDAAIAQLRGELSGQVTSLRERLIDIAARLEVVIDFSDEDVGVLDRSALRQNAGEVRMAIERMLASFRTGRLFREGARVVIVGKPNVGKSSLLNRLLKAERAIVAEAEGTTRDVIEEPFTVEGIPILLTDTAGIRGTEDPVENEGVARTRATAARADLALVVFDASRPFDAGDRDVIDAMRHQAAIYLINKIDLPWKLSNREIRHDLQESATRLILEVSAKTGKGVPELVQEIGRHLALSPSDAGVVVVRERHAVALQRSLDRLTGFVDALDAALPPDVLAVDVMSALDALGEIVGITTSNDVLDRVFREFCIGK